VTLHQGFELLTERRIVELNTNARLLRHAQTGAQLLSLENADENKVFCASFFTPPHDSTGVAHILEHSVLCGSRKYPLKEPFVELLKGSLQTFLNAFTFPDKTVYPAASQNLRDFYNLIDVYLDAVFYPRLTEQTLQQEGWHYELDALNGPLTYKGVVFNEMKGVYSSPDSLVGRYVQTSLYPDNIYGLESGGDPREIPTLTYEAFTRFHRTYYHPSNALLFFYGDDDPEERLRLLDGWLSAFEPAPVDRVIPAQPPFTEPRRYTYAFDAGAEGAEGKGFVTVNWRLVPNDDAERILGLAILADALIGTPAAPLRKALIDSGLGEDLAGAGLEVEVHPPLFSTGLRGVAMPNTDKVEPLILETLQRLVRDGIARETIEAALNTMEFRLREQNTGPFPRGLVQVLSALGTWLYGGDPLAPLAFEAPLSSIKERLARGERYFEGLLERYFVANPHRTTVVLAPEAGYAARQAAEEAARLAAIRDAMTAAERQAALENSAELQRRQVTPDPPEALATLPALTLADLDKTIRTIPLAEEREQGATLLYHDLFTNGIAYVDVGLDLHALPAALLPYATLFGRALLGMGTQTEDYVTLGQRIGRETGGIEATTFTSMTRRPGEPAVARLFLRGKATAERARELLAILRDLLLTAKLDDRERLRQIVLEEKAGAEAELVPNGHVVALRRLRAAFDEADWAAEQLSGTDYLLFLRSLAERLDADWPAVLERLETVRRTLVNREALLVNVTLDAANFATLRPALVELLAALPSVGPHAAPWDRPAMPANEGLAIPAQVNYVGKGANLYALGYTLHGSHLAVTNYLGTGYLWERVRVQGGAYGGFCVFDSLSGVFVYLSYRDPNLLQTVEAYDRAAAYLREHDLSQAEVERSIIGAVGTLDAYQLPDAKGYTSLLRYLTGETDELRQRRRDELLGATVADFRRFGAALEPLGERGRVVVVGGQPAFDAVNAARPGWLAVRKLLG
jgi:Zn-dependent M16 (insulinase) family peptidase